MTSGGTMASIGVQYVIVLLRTLVVAVATTSSSGSGCVSGRGST